jgi:hypothetical protein
VFLGVSGSEVCVSGSGRGWWARALAGRAGLLTSVAREGPAAEGALRTRSLRIGGQRTPPEGRWRLGG